MCNRYSGKSAIRRPFVCRRTPWNLSASLSPTKLPPSATLCAHVCEATRNRMTASLPTCTVGMRRDRPKKGRVNAIQKTSFSAMAAPVSIQRAYYVCPYCHQGQSSLDRTLDVERTEYSPGVRRMLAAVGSESSFHQGREQCTCWLAWTSPPRPWNGTRKPSEPI